jgi:hypothetical protein
MQATNASRGGSRIGTKERLNSEDLGLELKISGDFEAKQH